MTRTLVALLAAFSVVGWVCAVAAQRQTDAALSVGLHCKALLERSIADQGLCVTELRSTTMALDLATTAMLWCARRPALETP